MEREKRRALDVLEKTQMSKEETVWWSIRFPPRRKIFNAIIAGKTIKEIQAEFNVYRPGLLNTIRHPFFLKRLEDFLTVIYFNHQVQKIIAMEQVFNMCWRIAMGQEKSEEIDRNTAIRYLMSFFALRDGDKKVINPKQYNLIFQILKSEKENKEGLIKEELVKELGAKPLEGPASFAKEFGFEHLLNKDGEESGHTQMDPGDGDQDQQGSKD